MTGADGAPLRDALHALRTRLDLPAGFPPAVLAEAGEAARAPHLPGHQDATGLPMFTIDPPDSTDLDQAMYLERRPHGTATGCTTPSPTSPPSSGPAVRWTPRPTGG